MELLSTRPRDIDRAALIVRSGGVLAFPTDTVYGLGCDPRNPKAIKKLLSVKRERKTPFPILVSSERMASRIATVNATARVLISRFWPGPLTLVLKSRPDSGLRLRTAGRTIAVRCPENDVALRLIHKCGGVLIGTSANRSGERPCTSARMICHRLDDIDAVVDGGRAKSRVASTIVEVQSGMVSILRRGPIRESQIRRALLEARRQSGLRRQNSRLSGQTLIRGSVVVSERS